MQAAARLSSSSSVFPSASNEEGAAAPAKGTGENGLCEEAWRGESEQDIKDPSDQSHSSGCLQPSLGATCDRGATESTGTSVSREAGDGVASRLVAWASTVLALTITVPTAVHALAVNKHNEADTKLWILQQHEEGTANQLEPQ